MSRYHQVRIPSQRLEPTTPLVSKEHLGRRVAHLATGRLREVCDALGFALGCGG